MAQGIRHGILLTALRLWPNMKGNEEANEVADWVAGKPNSPMLLLFNYCQNSMSVIFSINSRIVESKRALDLVVGCFFAHL